MTLVERFEATERALRQAQAIAREDSQFVVLVELLKNQRFILAWISRQPER